MKFVLLLFSAVWLTLAKRMQPSATHRAEHARIHQWHFQESSFEKMEAFHQTSCRFGILAQERGNCLFDIALSGRRVADAPRTA
ncbi:MAG: hypothetical protein FJX20_15630 [Alphaproteobacteria bacterium]|nr:hypothetical protein [Alphaproteobacteria bacterium]